jgi:hypothetical protein
VQKDEAAEESIGRIGAVDMAKLEVHDSNSLPPTRSHLCLSRSGRSHHPEYHPLGADVIPCLQPVWVAYVRLRLSCHNSSPVISGIPHHTRRRAPARCTMCVGVAENHLSFGARELPSLPSAVCPCPCRSFLVARHSPTHRPFWLRILHLAGSTRDA